METAVIAETPWPVVTRSLLADHEKLAATHSPDQVNQPLFALIRARKALNDARLSILFCRRLHPDSKELSDRLESIASALALEHERFPLTILDNGGGHPRPRVFKQHEA